MSSPQDEHADDAAMEAAAANDAFGLNSLVDEKEELINGPAARKIAALPAKGTVANPDVLTEVLISQHTTSLCKELRVGCDKTTGSFAKFYFRHHAANRHTHEHQSDL